MGKLEKIITGFQTGADIGAARAAKSRGIPTGGYVPASWARKFMEYNVIPVYGASFNNVLVLRSMENVNISNGVIAFYTHYSVGTSRTIGYATTGVWKPFDNPGIDKTTILISGEKPVLIVQDVSSITAAARDIADFLRNTPGVINVCGHRAEAEYPYFEETVERIMATALDMYLDAPDTAANLPRMNS